MDGFTAWLEARDAATLERAWAALAPTRHEVGGPDWSLTLHAAARLAAAMLGWPSDRLAWLYDEKVDDERAQPQRGLPPAIRSEGRTVHRGFLEESYDLHGEYHEQWLVREHRDGDRGVQYVRVAFTRDEGGRDGLHQVSGKVVRIFDHATRTAAVVVIASQRPRSRTVATIGTVDLAPLDLVERLQNFRLATPALCDAAGARAMIAQLAAEIDAHFDVSTEWPGETLSSTASPRDASWVGAVEQRFQSGPRSIVIMERRFHDDHDVDARVSGLDPGYDLYVYISENKYGTFGHVKLRMPLALGTAVLARLVGMGAELS